MSDLNKIVNGKVVSIDNLDLFEKAAEDNIIGRTLPNIISNISELDFPKAQKYIDKYKEAYNAMPYPLYCIDSDLKYCTIGLFIKKEIGISCQMWTNDGLFVLLDRDNLLALGFVNNSWGIVHVDSALPDNLDIKQYRSYIGFAEFVWVASKLLKGEPTSTFYSSFMAPFCEACNGQAMILKWELGNILNFKNVPKRETFKPNKLINTATKAEYSIDIYTAGRRKTHETTQAWYLGSANKIETEQKSINVYGYDLYLKPLSRPDTKSGADKIKHIELYGVNSLFCTLCNFKNYASSDEFPDFTGIITSEQLIFEINSRIFIARSDKYVDAKEVARNVELYAFDGDNLYLSKQQHVTPGVKKETIYQYDMNTGKVSLCTVQFIRA